MMNLVVVDYVQIVTVVAVQIVSLADADDDQVVVDDDDDDDDEVLDHDDDDDHDDFA